MRIRRARRADAPRAANVSAVTRAEVVVAPEARSVSGVLRIARRRATRTPDSGIVAAVAHGCAATTTSTPTVTTASAGTTPDHADRLRVRRRSHRRAVPDGFALKREYGLNGHRGVPRTSDNGDLPARSSDVRRHDERSSHGRITRVARQRRGGSRRSRRTAPCGIGGQHLPVSARACRGAYPAAADRDALSMERPIAGGMGIETRRGVGCRIIHSYRVPSLLRHSFTLCRQSFRRNRSIDLRQLRIRAHREFSASNRLVTSGRASGRSSAVFRKSPRSCRARWRRVCSSRSLTVSRRVLRRPSAGDDVARLINRARCARKLR